MKSKFKVKEIALALSLVSSGSVFADTFLDDVGLLVYVGTVFADTDVVTSQLFNSMLTQFSDYMKDRSTSSSGVISSEEAPDISGLALTYKIRQYTVSTGLSFYSDLAFDGKQKDYIDETVTTAIESRMNTSSYRIAVSRAFPLSESFTFVPELGLISVNSKGTFTTKTIDTGNVVAEDSGEIDFSGVTYLVGGALRYSIRNKFNIDLFYHADGNEFITSRLGIQLGFNN